MVSFIIQSYVFILGLCFGSFANVVVYRMPNGKSLAQPPSHCPQCKTPLRWFELVPVLSWVLLRGKCRSCNSKISMRYPFVELLCGLYFLAVTTVYVDTVTIVYFIVLGYIFILIGLIDYDTQDIYNIHLWAIFGIFVSYSVFVILYNGVSVFDILPNLLVGLAASAIFACSDALTQHLAGQRGFGTGDIKLVFVLGCVFGLANTVFLLFLAVVIGGFVGAIGLISGTIKKNSHIAFGPFLMFAAMIVTLYPELVHIIF